MASDSVTAGRSSESSDDLCSSCIEEVAATRLRRSGHPQMTEIACFHQGGSHRIPVFSP
jgi:hypothetical protein